jgi:predicted Zn-dependent protease
MLFDGTTGSAGVRARVRVDAAGVTAERDGAPAVVLPAERLAVSLGGWDGAQVVLEELPPSDPPRMVFVGDAAAIAAVAGLAGTRAAEQARALQAARAKRSGARTFALAVVAVIALLFVIEVVHGLPTFTRLALHVVPVSWEIELGDAMVPILVPEDRRVSDPLIVKPVEAAFARLVAAAGEDTRPFKLRVIVARGDEVNAFAVPGGAVIVYTGLLDEAKSPDELAGVLAHELSHALRRHSVRALARQAGLSVLISLLSADASQVIALAGGLARLKFSRGQEREADREGALLLARAGLSIAPLAGFFDRLAEREKRTGRMPELLASHPSSADRAAELRELARSTGGARD